MKKSASIKIKHSKQHFIPFSFSNKKLNENIRGVILAADIGGTKANLALYKLHYDILEPIVERSFATKEYVSFFELFYSFMTEDLPTIDSICLGVAGPVMEGRVSGTNFSWDIDEEEIRQKLGVKWVTVINDLEANAYGLAGLEKEDFKEIKPGEQVKGNAAIVSPGTGLGEAGLYWDRKVYHPFATEGGHCDFSPRNEFDIEFLRYLQKEYGHVSWERILSGAGIYNIYKFYILYHQLEEPQWFTERTKNEDPAVVISSSAKEGNYAATKNSLELFTRYLAIEMGQVALKFKAMGGIYIGGGIVPKILHSFDKEVFVQNFLDVNRMNPLLEKIPVKLIVNQHAPKLGTAIYAAMQLHDHDIN